MNMDELISTCSNTVTTVVDSVSTGYRELPDIITDGIPEDIFEAGSLDSDLDPVDVENDIEELEKARSMIDSADTLAAVMASRSGLGGASDKIGLVRNLLTTFGVFATDCIKTIESFMVAWNLELRAVVNLFKAAITRLRTFVEGSHLDGTLEAPSDPFKAATDSANQGMNMFKTLGVTS